ncbi:MAG: diguanylate cyclase [Candidatus Izemoplasmatales bacterium]|jgi:diguanylate cyclase (GGDEF)-like protein|nr:GGDEF domain-containing protein [Candidatus Izemoplasmatales bacterium]
MSDRILTKAIHFMDNLYCKEENRQRFQKRVLCDVFLIVSFLIGIINLITQDYFYAIVMFCFGLYSMFCAIGFRYKKNTMIPSVLINIGSILMISYLLSFGIGNAYTIMWLIIIPNVITMVLSLKKAIIILLSILILMIVLYLSPLCNVLSIQFHEFFTKWHVVLFYAVFAFMAATFEYLRNLTSMKLEESRKEILRLSYYDDLTQIYNRRSFDEALSELFKTPYSTKRHVALLMIDIDNFKLYNDNYGHLQGDKILTKIAQTISSVITEETDTFARYGGEEFVVLMPDADNLMAVDLAEKIKSSVRELGLVYYDNFESASKYLSISIGVACEELSNLDCCETLIRLADENLYRAKKQGKNIVCSSADNPIHS